MTTINIMSYKYGHLAAQAIESVLNQTVAFDVVRLYDDGVGDCRHLKSLYPEVEIIQRTKNLGIIKNFNDALEATKTEQVMFLGADNWLRADTLEKLSEVDADIISYDAWIVGHGIDQLWHLPAQPHGSALYKTAKATSYQDSGREHTEEDSMMFTEMRKNGATFAHVDEPLLYYRRHRKNFNK